MAGCSEDHAIKIIDVENAGVIKQSIMTDYKSPLTIDSSQDNLILAGCEDGIVRLYDTRASKQNQVKTSFQAHQRCVTALKFNPQVENVFISGSHDGQVKLWDLRNDEEPLAVLKHKVSTKAELNDDYRVLAVTWNGASNILSGGSDSHISMHKM